MDNALVDVSRVSLEQKAYKKTKYWTLFLRFHYKWMHKILINLAQIKIINSE